MLQIIILLIGVAVAALGMVYDKGNAGVWLAVGAILIGFALGGSKQGGGRQ